MEKIMRRVILATSQGGLGEVSDKNLSRAYIQVRAQLEAYQAGQVRLGPVVLALSQAIQAEYNRRLALAASGNGGRR